MTDGREAERLLKELWKVLNQILTPMADVHMGRIKESSIPAEVFDRLLAVSERIDRYFDA